ncbi:MAG: type II toxin-antitoxin system prevent-host-death family antitoxin [Anaerolineae bacterium]|nr:type II toxin-antitoxin system prevent-host-death family antitoxin [Anaerolineae bacterium]
MSVVGAHEAKTRFPELLRRVQQGERITITRHGVPVAVLVPPESTPVRPVDEVIAAIHAFRKGRRAGIPLKTLIEEGQV